MQQDISIPVENESFLLIQGCKVTHPSWWDVPLQIPLQTPFPGVMGLGVLSSIACRSTVRGKWLSPAISIPYCGYRVSKQGSPIWTVGQQALLVDHSNVLKPGIVLQSIWPRWFYLLVIQPAALMFHSSFLPTLLVVACRRDRTSISVMFLHPILC